MSSNAYFDAVASEWDRMRSRFFSPAVRDKALRRAHRHMNMEALHNGSSEFRQSPLKPQLPAARTNLYCD
jgi:hypothetical protein